MPTISPPSAVKSRKTFVNDNAAELADVIVGGPSVSAPALEPVHAPHLVRTRRDTIRGIDWINVGGVGLIHVGALFALSPAFFSWTAVGVFFFLWWVIGSLGICMGYHRLLTHRSFKTPKFVEYLLTICGALAWEGSPIQWIGQHRHHHAESDQPNDPHSPRHGFDWAHIFWVFNRHALEHDYKQFAKDMLRDKGHVWIHRLHAWPNILLGVALFWSAEWMGFNGWSWVVWGIFVRGVVVFHATWMVNSIGHTWGYRNFETTDDSRNNALVAIVAFGEGWHNNHHACQRSAKHGQKWWEIDTTWMMIWLMSRVGLAWDIQGFKTPRR